MKIALFICFYLREHAHTSGLPPATSVALLIKAWRKRFVSLETKTKRGKIPIAVLQKLNIALGAGLFLSRCINMVDHMQPILPTNFLVLFLSIKDWVCVLAWNVVVIRSVRSQVALKTTRWNKKRNVAAHTEFSRACGSCCCAWSWTPSPKTGVCRWSSTTVSSIQWRSVVTACVFPAGRMALWRPPAYPSIFFFLPILIINSPCVPAAMQTLHIFIRSQVSNKMSSHREWAFF